MQLPELTQALIDRGVTEVGYSHLEGLLPERLAGLPFGLTLLFKLSDAVVDEILLPDPPAPSYPYFQHYRTVNAFLDAQALYAAAMLERMGARAFPVAASQSVPDAGEYAGLFPHKTAAVRAGLGWIGKSALFVSPKYGPRVRLATVLTDYPLPSAPPVELPGCGSCSACVMACPACAIKGAPAEGNFTRSDLFDPAACSTHMKRAYQHIGRGAVCGICMAVCPFGRKRREPETPAGAEKAVTSALPER